MPFIEQTVHEKRRDCKNHPRSLWGKKSNGEWYRFCYEGSKQINSTGETVCEPLEYFKTVTYKKWVE